MAIITDRAFLERPSRETSVEECRTLNIFDILAQELAMSPIAGVGLAACQVGVPIRASLMVTDKKTYRMVNPVITGASVPIIHAAEGCLSAGGKTYNTDRFNFVTMEWLDYDDGLKHRAETEGFNAVVLQHELDHMDGILNYRREHKHAPKIGRNQLCPYCENVGLHTKWKRCKIHNK